MNESEDGIRLNCGSLQVGRVSGKFSEFCGSLAVLRFFSWSKGFFFGLVLFYLVFLSIPSPTKRHKKSYMASRHNDKKWVVMDKAGTTHYVDHEYSKSKSLHLSFPSPNGRPRTSISIGTPTGADAVASGKLIGTQITRLPVTAARMPFLPACEVEARGTTRAVCSG